MLNREEAEKLIEEKLLEIQKIMAQFEGNSHRVLCADVWDNTVCAFQFSEGQKEKTINVRRDDYDISD